MLVRLLPDQVEKLWDILAPMIEESLPPTEVHSGIGMVGILRSLLIEDMLCWIYYGDTEETQEDAYTIALTTEQMNRHTDTRNFMIYALYGIQEMPREWWMKGFETLEEYAKSRNCKKVIAYSNIPSIVRFWERLGGSNEFRFLTMEV